MSLNGVGIFSKLSLALAGKSRQASSSASLQGANTPTDTVQLSPAKTARQTNMLNVVSMLSIAGAIGTFAAGLVLLPAVLVGVTLATGAMALSPDSGSKYSAWRDQQDSAKTTRPA